MRQIPKLIHHSAALKVYNHKADVIRMEQKAHGEHIRLKQLTFTGTCCSGNKSVRSVILLVQIQIDDLIL